MHIIQQRLLKIAQEHNLGKIKLRNIASLLNVAATPQLIDYHLRQLEKNGFISWDRKNDVVTVTKTFATKVPNEGVSTYPVPILGVAKCGPASLIADEYIEGYLRVSPSLLPKRSGLFAIEADGESMNRANVNGKNIEDGDFVLIDGKNQSARDGDIVLAVIDGMGVIKEFRHDKEHNQIALRSLSTEDIPPIFIHEDDNFQINGKVVGVIKNVIDK